MWEPLEYMGIAQSLPTAYKNTFDFMVNNQGYGLPATRCPPYADYGIMLAQDITGSGTPQTVSTASYGANRLGLEVGRFVHIDLGGSNEEYVAVLAVDPDDQTFNAVVTGNHLAGERPASHLANACAERGRRLGVRHSLGRISGFRGRFDGSDPDLKNVHRADSGQLNTRE